MNYKIRNPEYPGDMVGRPADETSLALENFTTRPPQVGSTVEPPNPRVQGKREESIFKKRSKKYWRKVRHVI